METYGRHFLVEYHGCDASVLDNMELLERSLRRAAQAAKAHVINALFHRFMPHGVSGVVVIQESHLSIHTWPESGYAAVDFYTCGECMPQLAHDVLLAALAAESFELLEIERGTTQKPNSMHVKRHEHGAQPSIKPASPSQG